MKKIIVLISLVSLVTFSANAQKKTDNGQMNAGKEHSKEMMKDLNLSKDQRKQMKSFKEENKGKMQEIKNNTSLSNKEKKEQLKQMHKQQQDKLNTILTPEQKEKMKEKMKQNRSLEKGPAKQKDPIVSNPDNH